MATGLINNPAERTARMEAKRLQILRFLRDEIYTTREVVEALLGVTASPAKQTLAGMQRAGLIRHAQVQTADHSKFDLWGITNEGQAMAFDLQTETPKDRIFEPGRVGTTVLRHTIYIQLARLTAERAGYKDWQNGDRLDKWAKDQGRPDALTTTPSGAVLAIEMELTIKSTKRYEDVIFDRLRQIKNGNFESVCWMCETRAKAERLQAMLYKIEAFSREVQGRKIDVKITDEHRSKLFFSSLADWPNLGVFKNGTFEKH